MTICIVCDTEHSIGSKCPKCADRKGLENLPKAIQLTKVRCIYCDTMNWTDFSGNDVCKEKTCGKALPRIPKRNEG